MLSHIRLPLCTVCLVAFLCIPDDALWFTVPHLIRAAKIPAGKWLGMAFKYGKLVKYV